MRAFLFSDLRGYTAFVERQGDGAAAKLLRDYRTLVRREIARQDGAEVKTEGDSFYVVFERPSAALACAVAIQRRAGARNAEDREALRIGMGLHAGEVIPHDAQYVGSAVNIAARLASKADAGEIVMSETMRSLLRTGMDLPLTDRGPLRLKGMTERVRAWRVEWARVPADVTSAPGAQQPVEEQATRDAPPAPQVVTPAAPQGQLLCPALIGRDAELAQISVALERATAGAGATLIVGGEAGVGKSALVRESQLRASASGFRLLTGVTHESGAGLPYGPFIAAIRSGFRGLERDRLARFLQQAAPALAQLFPELERPGTRSDAGSGVEHQKLSVAFQDVVRAFARERPVFLAIEDLHWADEASLELLHDLARELRDARVVLLATYRSDEMHRRHPFLRTLAGLQRERLATVLQVRRLTREEVGELIRLTFAHPRAITPEFLDAIYARSDGNPYFSEELLKVLAESGEIYFDPGSGEWTRGGRPIAEMRIPDSIVEAVRARVDRLSPEARRTLEVAAVVGLRIPFETLVGIRGLPDTDVEPHLRELIEQQLLSEHGRDEDAYSFRHALTREVIYDDLLVSERKRLHRAVASALAQGATAEPALIAHHLIAGGESVQAVPHLLNAGDRALAAGAPRESVGQYERAMGIGLPDDATLGVLERVAGAYMRFDGRRAMGVAEDLVARARRSGDRRLLSRALQMVAALHFGLNEGAERDAATREAIAAVAGDECTELARATVQLASWRALDADGSEAIRLADEALALGERLGDGLAVGRAIAVKGLAIGWSDPDEGLTLLLRARDLLLETGQPAAALSAHNNAAVMLMELERPRAEREKFIDEGIALAKRHGIEVPVYLGFFQALHLIDSGDWDGALEKGALIDEGTRRRIESRITAGRNGPEASLPLELAQADSNIKRATEYTVVDGYGIRAAALADAGDFSGGRAALDDLRAHLDRHPGSDRHLGRSPSADILLLAALRCDRPAWIEAIWSSARERRPSARQRATLEAVAAARAVVVGDPRSCASELERRQSDLDSVGAVYLATSFTIGVARDVRRRGLTLGPEWRPLFDRCRTFAERAKATWWLSVLDELGP